MTNVLVVGAGGQLGAAVCAALHADEHEVFMLARRGVPEHAVVLPAPWRVAALKVVLVDLAIDAIVNLAGAGVRPGESDEIALFEANVSLPGMLVEAAAATGCTMVNIGSGAEYRGSRIGLAIDEAAPLNIDHAYGLSKVAGGFSALALARALGVRFVHLRLFGAYGEHEAAHRLLPSLVSQLSRSNAVALSDGRQVRDWLYEGDVASAIAAVVAAQGRGMASGFYNLGSGAGHSVQEFAWEVASILEADPALLKFGVAGRRGGEVDSLVADCTSLRAATGWAPKYAWRRGLALAIARLRERYADEKDLEQL